jgi:hypothetical protein
MNPIIIGFTNDLRGFMKLETERLEIQLLTLSQLKLWVNDIQALENELKCKYDAEPTEGLFLNIINNQIKIIENDPEANSLKDVLHRIRVKLYPNYLPGREGTYMALANSEASISVEQVCVTLKNRGGFTGSSYDSLVENVRQYLDECAYQICDGFTVNMKYFSVYPKIGGMFASAGEEIRQQKAPCYVSFPRPFRVTAPCAIHRRGNICFSANSVCGYSLRNLKNLIFLPKIAFIS